MSNDHDVIVPAPLDGVAAVADDNRAAAGGRGGFPDLNNRRFRIAFFYAVWGVAGMITSTTTAPSSSSINLDHVALYFVFLMAGVVLFLLSIAAADKLPWMEGPAARLEGILAAMIVDPGF